LSILISTFFDTLASRFSCNQWIQQLAKETVGATLASVLRYHKRNMFRISTVDTRSQRRLVVEGMLVGPWVDELRTSWRNACRERGRRKLVIDLRNLTTISRAGEDAIFELMNDGARFSCGNVLTKHVLKQLARKKRQELPGC
jgi:hypothetical protein